MITVVEIEKVRYDTAAICGAGVECVAAFNTGRDVARVTGETENTARAILRGIDTIGAIDI